MLKVVIAALVLQASAEQISDESYKFLEQSSKANSCMKEIFKTLKDNLCHDLPEDK